MSNKWSTFQGGAARTGQTPSTAIVNWYGSDITSPSGAAISEVPVVGADGTLYYPAVDGTINACSPTGQPLWSYAGPSNPTGLSVAADGTIYYGNSSGLTSLGKTGIPNWTYSVYGPALGGTVISSAGLIYLPVAGSHGQPTLLGTRPNMSGDVCLPLGGIPNGRPPAYGPGLGSSGGGLLVLGCTNGDVLAYDVSWGLQWHDTSNAGGTVVGSPAFGPDGSVYLLVSFTTGVQLVAYSSSGTVLWRYSIGGTVGAKATPAISPDGTLVYVGAQSIHAVVAASGASQWESYAMGSPGTLVITSDMQLYTGTSSSSFQTLNANTGAYLVGIERSPGTGDMSIGNDGSMYALGTGGQIMIFVGPTPPASTLRLWYGASYPPAIQKLTSSALTLVENTTSSPTGIAVDPATGDVYWVDGPTLHRYTGSGTEMLAQFPFNLTGLALDLANNRAFSCNASGGLIVSLDFAGTATTLVSGLKLPVSVAVDVSQNLLVWAEYNPGRIQKAGLDGSNITLVVDDLALSQSVVVDPTTQRIYWADKSSVSGCDYTGQNCGIIASTAAAQPSSNSRKLAIDTAGGKLYWTDQTTQSIQQINTDGSQLSTLVSHADNSGFDNPTVIAVSP